MQQLVIKFNHKDTKAIAWMYEINHPYATALVERFTKEQEETIDLTQEVLTTMLEHRRPFQDFREVRLFLYKTARNICLNACKRQQMIKDKFSDVQDDYLSGFTQDYYHAITQAELSAFIYRSIEKLPAKTKSIFRLLYYDDMTNREIANHLGIPEKTVANHKTNAYRILRWELRGIKRFVTYLLNLFL
jgi:RNA polymerase sigma factor (sigma-70 family)